MGLVGEAWFHYPLQQSCHICPIVGEYSGSVNTQLCCGLKVAMHRILKGESETLFRDCHSTSGLFKPCSEGSSEREQGAADLCCKHACSLSVVGSRAVSVRRTGRPRSQRIRLWPFSSQKYQGLFVFERLVVFHNKLTCCE